MSPSSRITFRAPPGLVAAAAAVLLGPRLALLVFLVHKHPALQPVTVLKVWAPTILFKCAVLLALYLVRIPVSVDATGIRYAWFWRLAWSEVVTARVRTWVGIPMLHISRQRGVPWRIFLYGRRELPGFLARHAPDGNPLRHVAES